jgi:hypothetical protein
MEKACDVPCDRRHRARHRLFVERCLAPRTVDDSARHRVGVGAAGEDAATVDPDIADAGRELVRVGDR